MPKTLNIENELIIATVTGSVACDVKTQREWYRKNINNIISICDEGLKYFKLENEKIKFHFRNIRGKTRGQYFNLNKKVEICLKSLNLNDVAKTIIHELVHVDQYKTGRLKTKGVKSVFNKKEFNNKTKTHEEYLNLPWEIEARTKADEITPKILDKLFPKKSKKK